MEPDPETHRPARLRWPLVDTHCHLGLADFDRDREAVIARARAAGVAAACVVGQTDAENERVLSLAEESDGFLRPLSGQHPDHPDPDMARRSLAFARRHRDRLAGIGEIGLDFRRDQTEDERARQIRIFEAFIDLALELELGMTIHSRGAGRHAIDILKARGAKRAVMHAFDGRAGHALRALEHGILFSIPPSIVRSRQKQKLARALPLEALLLESDAPALGPERGARNEPRNVVLALVEIAAQKKVEPDEVAWVTTENARRVFRLDGADGSGPIRGDRA